MEYQYQAMLYTYVLMWPFFATYCELRVARDLGEHLVLGDADNPGALPHWASHRAGLDGVAACDVVAGWHDGMARSSLLLPVMYRSLSLQRDAVSLREHIYPDRDSSIALSKANSVASNHP